MSFRSIRRTKKKQYFLHLLKILATLVPSAVPSLGRRADGFGQCWLGVWPVQTEVSFGVIQTCIFLRSHT